MPKIGQKAVRPTAGDKSASHPFRILHGNCLNVLPTLPAKSIDAVVTDPPYELGFMGKSWDSSGIAYNVEMWSYVLRALKPGGYLLAFSGTRTYHRMVCAIEDAGFDICDQLAWVFGSGFPKGLNASKGVDKFFGYEREMMRYEQGQSAGSANTVGGSNRSGAKGESRPWIEEAKRKGFHEAAGDTPVGEDAKKWYGWGSSLKPAYEPIVLAQKPLDGSIARNLTRHGTGAMNIDGCRVGTSGATLKSPSADKSSTSSVGGHLNAKAGISIDKGRWPTNLIHDGSEEATAGFPKTGATKRQITTNKPSTVFKDRKGFIGTGGFTSTNGYDEPAGSAARYFYCAKASRLDRDEGLDDLPISQTAVLGISEICAKCGVSQRHAYEPQNKGKCDHEWTGSPQRNIHTTVKPVSLMRWLVRLITPPGGTVLDPFTGSGSTGKACGLEGMKFTGIEMTDEYLEIARLRTQFGYDNYGSKE